MKRLFAASVLTSAFFVRFSKEARFAWAGKASVVISTDGMFGTVVRSGLAFVNIRTGIAVPSETFSANTFKRSICVNTLDAIFSKTAIVLVVGAFVYVLTGKSISYKAIVAAAIVAFLSVYASGQFVTFVNTKLTFIGKSTVFDPISYITLLALAFVATNKVHALTEWCMASTTNLQWYPNGHGIHLKTEELIINSTKVKFTL